MAVEALEVRYDEIRSNVIAKLQELQEEMVGIHKDMDTTVNDIIGNNYMAGDAACAYASEFNDPITELFQKLNTGIQTYCDQLESVCKEFEKQDAEVSGMLNFRG